jgi:hypothetical protein
MRSLLLLISVLLGLSMASGKKLTMRDIGGEGGFDHCGAAKKMELEIVLFGPVFRAGYLLMEDASMPLGAEPTDIGAILTDTSHSPSKLEVTCETTAADINSFIGVVA